MRTCEQIAVAVALLSPVTTMRRMPAALHSSMAPLTSFLGASCMPTSPIHVSSDSSSLLICSNATTSRWYAVKHHAAMLSLFSAIAVSKFCSLLLLSLFVVHGRTALATSPQHDTIPVQKHCSNIMVMAASPVYVSPPSVLC